MKTNTVSLIIIVFQCRTNHGVIIWCGCKGVASGTPTGDDPRDAVKRHDDHDDPGGDDRGDDDDDNDDFRTRQQTGRTTTDETAATGGWAG